MCPANNRLNVIGRVVLGLAIAECHGSSNAKCCEVGLYPGEIRSGRAGGISHLGVGAVGLQIKGDLINISPTEMGTGIDDAGNKIHLSLAYLGQTRVGESLKGQLLFLTPHVDPGGRQCRDRHAIAQKQNCVLGLVLVQTVFVQLVLQAFLAVICPVAAMTL